MPFKTEDKWKAIEDLQAIHRDGQVLEIELRFSKKEKQAEAVWASNVILGQQIDVLIGKAIDGWLAEAKPILKKLAKAAGGIQASINDIADTIKKQEKIVKAIGYIDDAVKIAAKLAKYL